MEVTGKIIVDCGETSGVSKAGREWKKHAYVLETQESYPKKIFFDFFGERADQYPLQVGQTVKLSFDIDSREYQGRWFTSISGWKAEPAEAVNPFNQPAQAAPAPAPAAYAPAAVPTQNVSLGASEPTDDLPF